MRGTPSLQKNKYPYSQMSRVFIFIPVMPRGRIELPTQGASSLRSTNELPRQIKNRQEEPRVNCGFYDGYINLKVVYCIVLLCYQIISLGANPLRKSMSFRNKKPVIGVFCTWRDAALPSYGYCPCPIGISSTGRLDGRAAIFQTVKFWYQIIRYKAGEQALIILRLFT